MTKNLLKPTFPNGDFETYLDNLILLTGNLQTALLTDEYLSNSGFNWQYHSLAEIIDN